MPDKTARECQITWKTDWNMDQSETTRRVSRGALKQEVDSERKRTGFYRRDRTDPHQESRAEVKRQGRGEGGEDNLDVLTSPFRALAESCGFKVICEEEVEVEISDTNSVLSLVGSATSEPGDVTGSEYQESSRRRIDRVRIRRCTPGVDVGTRRSVSPSRDNSSSADDSDDSTEICNTKLVSQRQAQDTGKKDGDIRYHFDGLQDRDHKHGPSMTYKKAQIKRETIYEDKPRLKNKTRVDDMKHRQHVQSCEKRKSPEGRAGQFKDVGGQRVGNPNQLRHCSDGCGTSRIDSPWPTRIDSPRSTEDTGSSGTYKTVKGSLSPDDADIISTQRKTEKYLRARCARGPDKALAGHTKSDDFNESSSCRDQTALKPKSQRPRKIFMELVPNMSLRERVEDRVVEAGDESPLKVGKVLEDTSMKMAPNNENSSKDHDRVSHGKVEQPAAVRKHEESDTQGTAQTKGPELKKPGGGAAFRISRKLTACSEGSKCGVTRYFRSAHDGGKSEADPTGYDDTEKLNKHDLTQHLGGGDGNTVLGPCVKAEATGGHAEEGKISRHDMPDNISYGRITDGSGRGNRNKTSSDANFRGLEAGDAENEAGYEHYLKCDSDRRGRYVLKKGCAQDVRSHKQNKLEEERDTLELQVFSEISKLRGLAVNEKTGCEIESHGNIRTMSDRHEVSNVTRDLGLQQQKTPSADYQNGLAEFSQQEQISIDHPGDWNPRNPSTTDALSKVTSHIHLNVNRDGQPEDNHDHLDDDHVEAKDTHPRRSGSKLVEQSSLVEGHALPSTRETRLKMDCDSTAKNQSYNKYLQKPPPSYPLETQPPLPAGEGIVAGSRDSHNCKQPGDVRPPHLQCENRLTGHNLQNIHNCHNTNVGRQRHTLCKDTPTSATVRHVTIAPVELGGNRAEDTSERPNTQETEEGTKNNHNHYQHKQQQQQQQQQHPPHAAALHHHKDLGFNINFNYEGSDDGEGGAAGSRFIGQYFLELWKNQCLCDVRLRVGNWSYLAHKIVLAAFSDFFCPNDPHSMPSICFDIPNATPDAVHQILLYLYTSEMEITDYTLESVLCAAESLGVSEVINLVKEILENPTPENFEHYLEIRNRHGFPGRLTDYTELIREHLLDLTSSTYFLEFDLCDLQQILGDPEVKVDSECDIIDVIARWIEYSPLERITYSADLLQYVNFDCIPAESLADVVERKRHVFSRDAFSIFLDAFKARSMNAECAPCQQPSQKLWPCGGANGGGNNLPFTRITSATNKSTNADSYRPQLPQQQQQQPQQQQIQPQQPLIYDLGENNSTQSRALHNGGNSHDSFRSPSKSRRDNSRIPRSSQNKMAALLGRAGSSHSWASDGATSRPSTGMSSRQFSGPRRFATTQSRTATPREIMSMTSRGDYEANGSWGRPGKQHRITRVTGGGGGVGGGSGAGYTLREPIGVPSDTALNSTYRGGGGGGGGSGGFGRRGYRCSNGNAVFSPPSDADISNGGGGGGGGSIGSGRPMCGPSFLPQPPNVFPLGTPPACAVGVPPIWDDGTPYPNPPTSPGWSKGSGGSFVASPWPSPGPGVDALPPGCSTFRVTRGGRGPRWEQRSRSPSGGHGSRERSSSKRVTFM